MIFKKILAIHTKMSGHDPKNIPPDLESIHNEFCKVSQT